MGCWWLNHPSASKSCGKGCLGKETTRLVQKAIPNWWFFCSMCFPSSPQKRLRRLQIWVPIRAVHDLVFKALWATMTDRWFQLPGIVRTTGQNNFGYLRWNIPALLEIWLLNMRIFRPCYILRGWQVTHRKAEHMECLSTVGQLGTSFNAKRVFSVVEIPQYFNRKIITWRAIHHGAQISFKDLPQ